MKIIFLDIDGVLSLSHLEDGIEIPKPLMERELDKNCLKNLMTLVEKTNGKIVITSDWRKNKELMKKLEVLGIFGVTTDLGNREDEILIWLSENKKLNIESFVIIDDDIGDFEMLVGRVVLVDSTVGITEWDVGVLAGLMDIALSPWLRV